MRSEQVFAAIKTIGNRFLLCRVAAVATRRFQIAGTPFPETISKSLREIASVVRDSNGWLMSSRPVLKVNGPLPHRDAAADLAMMVSKRPLRARSTTEVDHGNRVIAAVV